MKFNFDNLEFLPDYLKKRFDDTLLFKETNPNNQYKNNRKRTILITGGAGFIGSHLTTWLFELGYHIIVLDKFYKTEGKFGRSDYLKYYKQLLPKELQKDFIRRVQKIDFDLLNSDSNDFDKFYDNATRTQYIDLCIHLASEVGVSNILNNNKTTFNSLKINTNVFSFLEKFRIPVIFASTSEIFGENENIRNHTDSSISTPEQGRRGGYASQKLASEFMFTELPFSAVVRFFNITGVGQEIESGMVLPNLVSKIQKEKEIVINNKATRIFSDIDSPAIKIPLLLIIRDMIEHSHRGQGKPFKDPIVNGKTINIGLSKDLHFREKEVFLKKLHRVSEIIWSTLKKEKNWSKYFESKITMKSNFYKHEINYRELRESNDLIFSIANCFSYNDSSLYEKEINYEHYLKNLIYKIASYQLTKKSIIK